jgi:hypothetical protein
MRSTVTRRSGDDGPDLSGSEVDRRVYHNIYEPLLTLDTRLGIKARPRRVVDPADPKMLVFKLRRGVSPPVGSHTCEVVRFALRFVRFRERGAQCAT